MQGIRTKYFTLYKWNQQDLVETILLDGANLVKWVKNIAFSIQLKKYFARHLLRS